MRVSVQPRGSVPAAVLTAVLSVPVLAVAGCTGSPDEPATGGPSSSAAVSPAPRPTKARLGVVSGRLPVAARDQVVAEVTAVVDRWLDAAYVAGDYPRSDFGDAFAVFTEDAATRARQHLRLLSNAGIGARISGVVVRARSLRVDVLAHEGEARAATARVRLVFGTEGDLERTVAVAGRLFLTRGPAGNWRVFGYDLSRGKA